MPNEIWKFPLKEKGGQSIEVPKGAEFLTLEEQHGSPTLWFLINPGEKEKEQKFIRTYGTGQAIYHDGPMKFLGSIFTQDKRFVWHFFMDGEQ